MNLTAFKRAFLLALLALTGVAAIITAVSVFRGAHTSETLGWAVKCAVGVGYLLIISFAAFTALERPLWRGMAIAGMLLAALLMIVVPIFVAWEISTSMKVLPAATRANLTLAQHLVESALLIAGLLCLIPFAMVPQMKRVGLIVQLTTILYLTFACIATIAGVWSFGGQRVEDAVVALIIPAGACLMGVFVLHKFFGIRLPDPLRGVAPAIHVRCPRCQCEQDLPEGRSQCSLCRLRFTIEVEEPRCPNCGFNLHLLTRPICPECGLHLDTRDVPHGGPDKPPDPSGNDTDSHGDGVIGQAFHSSK